MMARSFPPDGTITGEGAGEIAMSASNQPDILPFAPNLIGMKVEHIENHGGCVTIIARRFERPELCRLCPGGTGCNDGGFCMIRVEGYVPKDLCAGFTLAPPA